MIKNASKISYYMLTCLGYACSLQNNGSFAIFIFVPAKTALDLLRQFASLGFVTMQGSTSCADSARGTRTGEANPA